MGDFSGLLGKYVMARWALDVKSSYDIVSRQVQNQFSRSTTNPGEISKRSPGIFFVFTHFLFFTLFCHSFIFDSIGHCLIECKNAQT